MDIITKTTPPAEQWQEAKSLTKKLLEEGKEKDIVLSFSCGKDSLLSAVLLDECLEELNDNRKVYLHYFNSGYTKPTSKEWYKYLKQSLPPRFIWREISPDPFSRYGVMILGRGRCPITPAFRKWCSCIKRDLLTVLTKKHTQNTLQFNGVRAEESPARKKDLAENGLIRCGVARFIGNVTTTAVWELLEKKLEKIGISYKLLLDYYATNTRDGCWFCYAQKYDKPDTLEAAITLKLREYGRDKTPHWEQYRPAPDICRVALPWCKQWYFDLRSLENQFNKRLLNTLDKKIIFECWNWREQFNDVIKQKDFLRTYKDGSYKMLFPEIFDVVFQWNPRLKKYCYRYYVIKESDNNE